MTTAKGTILVTGSSGFLGYPVATWPAEGIDQLVPAALCEWEDVKTH